MESLKHCFINSCLFNMISLTVDVANFLVNKNVCFESKQRTSALTMTMRIDLSLPLVICTVCTHSCFNLGGEVLQICVLTALLGARTKTTRWVSSSVLPRFTGFLNRAMATWLCCMDGNSPL